MDTPEVISSEEFSISRHVQFLDGYLDAVGRTLTDDAELVSVCCLELGKNDRDPAQYMRIDNWSTEFCTLADDFLRMGARSRLGFYLVEYLCWFQHFTRGAVCYRGSVLADATAPRVVYCIEWPDGRVVQIEAQRLSKEHVAADDASGVATPNQ